jgi:hypothetical protein
MANEHQTGPTDPNQSTTQVIAARVKAFGLLPVAALVLLLFVGTLHADIFVSNFGNGTIERFNDAGQQPTTFVSGLGGTEGVSCVKLSSNELYAANNGSSIHVYNLTTGLPIRTFTVSGASNIAAISFSIDGSVLYVADYGGSHIFGVNPSNGTVIYHANTTASHDVRVGPDGYVYATYFSSNTGVVRFSKDLTTQTQFVAPGDHGLTRAAGMAFDATGNLWVTNFANPGGFISAYQNSAGVSTYLGTVPDNLGSPLGLDLGPDHNIYVANFHLNTISKIDIAGGTYQLSNFITTNLSNPKYVNFSENCCDLGYVEICKKSDPAHPVTGTYDFTATASFFTSPTIQVPVGQCSGSVQVPSGAVTVTETPVVGVAVSNVTAYSYDDLGFYVDELNSWLPPELHAIVNVVAGDVDLETLATFTNYAAPPGQLKICKVAGPGVPVGTVFTFVVSLPGGLYTRYFIPAGPPAQGGYCQLAGTYDVNTPVSIGESLSPTSPYQVSNITVSPADRLLTRSPNAVTVSIGDGVTETTVTNVLKRPSMMPANQFIPLTSGSVSQIDIAVGYVSGVNSFYASLWTSNGGLPDTQLARWDNLSSNTPFGQCCGLVTISGISGLTLVGGNSYFLVLGPENISSTTFERWNLNNTGVTGLDLYSTDGGITWNSNGQQTLGAFDVLGASSTLFSDLGPTGSSYQCCSGWQISGSGAVRFGH